MWSRTLRAVFAIAAFPVWFCSASTEASQALAPAPVPNRAPLQSGAFIPLPLGAIEPKGWLRRQLEIQAEGLTGHLGDFWADVGSNSGWLGGTGESWERGPYYLDGLLPLAYQLNYGALIDKARQWVDWTLSHQRPDGQIGPVKNDDWWPRMVMLKVLTQYQEATGDPRVIPLMTKYFAYQLRELPRRALRDWGKYRWQDNIYSVFWLYNRTGDRSLLDLARLLKQQGYDWQAQFADFKYTTKTTREQLGLRENHIIPDIAMQTHGVNNAMALKVSPIWWLLTGNATDRDAFARQVELLDKYHGLPNGMFSGDEHFAGPDPSQGIELCAVVEAMFSFEQAFAILGDPRIADRLEKVSYNALPGTLSNDMWSHQYDQQPNQISCTRARRQWSTNGDDSNLFGLQPNFGCCTANLHQGWPKFVSSLWMATHDGGLVTAAYAPSRVHVKLKDSIVSIDEETEYPFRGTARFVVHPNQPSAFPLVLRIPAWATSATIAVNGQKESVPVSGCNQPGCDPSKMLYRLQRTWKEGDTVTVEFPMEPRTSHSYHNSVVFERGPLVFSLGIKEDWREIAHYAEKSGDWQITPQTDWNYALQVGECDAKDAEHSIGAVPFDVQNPPVTLEVKGRRLPEWTTQENSAGPVPSSPVNSESPLQTLTLVPYGAAKLRVTAFPYLQDKSRCTVGSSRQRSRFLKAVTQTAANISQSETSTLRPWSILQVF